MEIYVVGKQWMWKLQHQGGQREINQLHVPVGRPVKLILTSEDVIHSFFLPAFRLKQDALPGRYVTAWFEATRPGRYDLFCAEYCGTDHSGMIGSVVVQEPAEFEAWLGSNAEGSLALEGRKLFLKLQCLSCHSSDARARAPVLESVYGQAVPLEGGGTVPADEGYLRESIRNPRAKVVQGWQPIMPPYGPEQVDELGLIQLVAYIKGLRPGMTPSRTEAFPSPAVAAEQQEKKP
jgi:cytochrome c oxidase subunit 2